MTRNEARMKQNRRKVINVFLLLAAFGAAALFLIEGTFRYGQWKQDRSGIPDVVASRTENGESFLIVVANAERIEDKQKFAWQVVAMYEKNEFHTTRFSRDMGEAPETVYMTVYLKKADIEDGSPVCEIEYKTHTGYISFEE